MEIRHEPVIVRGRRSRRSGRACATSLCAISSLQQMICCWLECYVQAHGLCGSVVVLDVLAVLHGRAVLRHPAQNIHPEISKAQRCCIRRDAILSAGAPPREVQPSCFAIRIAANWGVSDK